MWCVMKWVVHQRSEYRRWTSIGDLATNTQSLRQRMGSMRRDRNRILAQETVIGCRIERRLRWSWLEESMWLRQMVMTFFHSTQMRDQICSLTSRGTTNREDSRKSTQGRELRERWSNSMPRLITLMMRGSKMYLPSNMSSQLK